MNKSWLIIPFRELPIISGNGINPFEFPEEEFELYSVPSHEFGKPEVVLGKTIGSNKQIVSEGTVLLCKINPRINRTWIVRPNSGLRQIASTEWISFEPRTVLVPEYLMYYMQQSDFRDFLATNASGVGGSLMRIKPATFASYEFRMPGPRTQRAIVDKIEELFTDLDAGVAELKAAQKKLAQYRQSLLKSSVEGSLTAEWRSQNKPKETGVLLLGRILKERRARWEEKQLAKFKGQGKTPPKGWQDKYPEPVQPDTTNLPELPEGWVWASLDMLGEIASGVAKGTKRDADIPVREVPYLRVANVQRGYLDLSEVKTIFAIERDIEELTLKYGDVLFNEGGDRDKLGRGWVWREEVANCIHQNHVFRMRPYLPDIVPELISHHGNTFGKSWFQDAGKQTTNLASINMTMLRAFPVPLAPTDEQCEILEQVQAQLESLDRQSQAVELALKQSTAQRKNILKSAFSGQLVPQDPNDEPASILLERIIAGRKESTAIPKPKRLPKKKSLSGHDVATIKNWIVSYSQTYFSYDELRQVFVGDDNVLKEILLKLLEAEEPVVRQVFCELSKSIKFMRVTK